MPEPDGAAAVVPLLPEPPRRRHLYGTGVLGPGFLTFAVLAVVLPGPDTVLVLRYAAKSRRTALRAVGGICAGLTTHTCVSAAGVSAVVTALPGAQDLLQLVGGLFLIYLGAAIVRSDAPGEVPGIGSGGSAATSANTPSFRWSRQRRERAPAELRESQPQRSIAFVAGLAVNLTNVKTWLVFATVIPALLRTDGYAGASALLLGGAVLTALAALWYGGLAVLVSARRAAIQSFPRALDVLCAGTLLGLGGVSVVTALTA